MKHKQLKKIITNNVDETIKFAIDYAKNIIPNDIICLNGDLGVGKTVIAKSFGNFFCVSVDITSPTFNLVKTYKTKNNLIKKIHHFDLYRIKNIDELENIGFDEYIYDDNTICLIEWPEIAYDILPNSYKLINILKLDDNKREIEYE